MTKKTLKSTILILMAIATFLYFTGINITYANEPVEGDSTEITQTETTTDDILKGYELCQKLSRSTGIPIVFSTCAKHLADELKAQTKDAPDFRIFPMTLQMRPSWLDVPVG